VKTKEIVVGIKDLTKKQDMINYHMKRLFNVMYGLQERNKIIYKHPDSDFQITIAKYINFQQDVNHLDRDNYNSESYRITVNNPRIYC